MIKTFMVIFIIAAVICGIAAIWNIVKSIGRQLNKDGTLVTADVKAARKTRGIVFGIVAAVFVIAAIVVNAGGASGKGSDKKDKESSSTTSGSAVEAEEEDTVDIEDVAMPPVDLNKDTDALFAKYSKWLHRGGMPIMAKSKRRMTMLTRDGKVNKKQGFEDAVSIPLWADQAWFDDGFGFIRNTPMTDNPLGVADLGASPTERGFKAMAAQSVEWMKEFDETLKNAKDFEEEDYIIDIIKERILRDPVYCDMWVQVFAKEELITYNNPWLLELKAEFDAAYEDGIGVRQFVQFEEGHTDEQAWIRVTDKHFENAKKVCLIFDYLTGVGFKKLESMENYHLLVATDANLSRTSLNDKQEDGNAYILIYRVKPNGKQQTLLKFGANDKDARAEKFSLEKKVKIKTPDTTPDPTDPPSVTTPPENSPKGTLVVHYVYKNGPKKGQQAAKDKTATKYVGQIAEINSPKIKGYTASKSIVSEKIKKDTIERTVYYTKNGKTPKYTLTIKYRFKDGSGPAAPTYNKTGLKKGDSYSRKSPTVANHKPDKAVVSGTMPGHDVTVTVLYSRNTPGPTPTPDATPHKLTINYKFKSGGQAAPSHKEALYAGAKYSVKSPKIDGYKPSKTVVSGTMPDRDLTLTVTYTKDGDGAKDPMKDPVQNDKAPTGGGDNKPGNGNGDAQVTPKPASPTMTPKPTKKPVESNDENGTTHGGNPPATGNITNNAQTGTDGNGNKIPTATDKPAGKLESDGF